MIDDILSSMTSDMYGDALDGEPTSCPIEEAMLDAYRESRRHAAVASLLTYFNEICNPVLRSKKGYIHFESWLWSRRQACESTEGEMILPEGAIAEEDSALSSKLIKAGCQPPDAQKVCCKLGRKSSKLAKELRQEFSKCNAQLFANTKVAKKLIRRAEVQGHESQEASRYLLVYQNCSLEINCEHYRDLERLYVPLENELVVEEALSARIFALLARYSSAQGTHSKAGGNQAAVYPSVMHVLVDRCGVVGECFASPFNCYLRHVNKTKAFQTSNNGAQGEMPHFTYCSAFPDVDRHFGSIGTFESFSPEEGAYEANPPFEPAVVVAMYMHMEALLAKASANRKPLTFVVILPHWGPADRSCAGTADCEKYAAWEMCAKSSYVRKTLHLLADSHGYMLGAQHAGGPIRQQASIGTDVFFLQTSEAVRCYPGATSEQTMKRLRQAFSHREEVSTAPSVRVLQRHACKMPAPSTHSVASISTPNSTGRKDDETNVGKKRSIVHAQGRQPLTQAQAQTQVGMKKRKKGKALRPPPS